LLARAYSLGGDRLKAQHILEDLHTLSRQQYVSPFDFAVIHYGLGDLTSAFHWLEQGTLGPAGRGGGRRRSH
jgi:hypothetical protein